MFFVSRKTHNPFAVVGGSRLDHFTTDQYPCLWLHYLPHRPVGRSQKQQLTHNPPRLPSVQTFIIPPTKNNTCHLRVYSHCSVKAIIGFGNYLSPEKERHLCDFNWIIDIELNRLVYKMFTFARTFCSVWMESIWSSHFLKRFHSDISVSRPAKL